MRNEYNFLYSFWMKQIRIVFGYYRIWRWNRIEKINKNRIRMYPLYYHIKLEYGCGYPYWYLSGYRCRIIRISAIRFPSLLIHTCESSVSAIDRCIFLKISYFYSIYYTTIYSITIRQVMSKPDNLLTCFFSEEQHAVHCEDESHVHLVIWCTWFRILL